MSDDNNPASPTEMARALRRCELVCTHVWHPVKETHDDGRVSTMCDYYLYVEQYQRRLRWGEAPVTVTQICHHCARTLRDKLSAGDEV